MARIPAGHKVRKKEEEGVWIAKDKVKKLTSQVPEYGQEGTTSEARLVSAKGFFRSQ